MYIWEKPVVLFCSHLSAWKKGSLQITQIYSVRSFLSYDETFHPDDRFILIFQDDTYLSKRHKDSLNSLMSILRS